MTTEEAKPLAKVGDWVRTKSSNGVVGDPFKVEHVDGSAVWEKSVYRHQHGQYEILRRVVRPWTFAEACVSLANAGMTVHSAFAYEVVGVAADGITIGNGRHRGRFTFRDIAGLFAFPNGERAAWWSGCQRMSEGCRYAVANEILTIDETADRRTVASSLLCGD